MQTITMGSVYKKIIAACLIVQALFSGCEKDLDLDIPVTPTKLVVEGWIENGRIAEIILSHSAPYFSAIDSTTLPSFAESHAKVTLSSDTESEILTLSPNTAYFPPLVYRSVEIKGTAGKVYAIEVILEGDTITASTTIQQPVLLDSVWFARDPGAGENGRLWIRLTDDGRSENYYRILYKRKGKDSTYVATGISTFNDGLFNGTTVEMGFERGLTNMMAVEEDHYFTAGDTISVKFCTIDEDQFAFWNVYQNEVMTSANPLATSNNQLASNVRGGLGIWSGYGATYYLVYAK
jgi:hypothetical protein